MTKLYLTFSLVLAVLLCACAGPEEQAADADGEEYLTYFGTYTRGDSESDGVYVSRLSAVGKLSPPELAAETPNPSFLAIHPNNRFLYSASEMSGDPGGAVSAFAIGGDGKLTLLNTVSSRGGGPCHLNVDATGRCLVVANYGSGSVAAMPVNADGSLGEAAGFIQHEGSSVDPRRQKGPHAHSVNFSPDNRFVIAADLGLDKLLVYRVDPANATLDPHDPPFAEVKPGSGPRHFTFHPNGKFAYVINEMASTVTAFAWDAQAGTLSEIETLSTLPAGFDGSNHTAEVRVHPSGRFLYGSNRGHDSIAVFAIGQETGKLQFIETTPSGGTRPRNFSPTPDGRFLVAANQDTNNVVVFQVDQESGRLTPAGSEITVGSPVCVRFVPAP